MSEGSRRENYDSMLCFSQAAEKKSYVLRVKAFADTEAGRLLARMEAGKKRYGWEREMALFVRAVPAGGKPTLSGRGNRKEKFTGGHIQS